MAAGVKKPTFPDELKLSKPARSSSFPQKITPPKMMMRNADEPLYVKVEVYQKILGELQSIKRDLSTLNNFTKKIEESEFNEKHNFNKLKGEVKVMHDKLLLADKVLFKGD